MTYDEILSQTPANPVHAHQYAVLYNLWKTAHESFLPGDADEDTFNDWDKMVEGLLTPKEREFYVSPLGNLDMSVFDFRTVSRINHLTKILVHRQGIKTTNGFNG